MIRIAKLLTDYVIRKHVVNEEDRVLYEYGFTLFLERGIFVLGCVCIASYFHMYIEGILFFVIFSPLRSYAGGLHLKNFWTCFLLSCISFLVVLFVVKYFYLPYEITLLLLPMLELLVYILYPVEHINRKVDEDENKYFKAKLQKYLCLDFVLGVVCAIMKEDRALLEIDLVIFIIVMTMYIGKRYRCF